MTKTDFVKAIAEKAEISIKDADKFLNAFIGVVTENLKKGVDISIIGFGSFSVTERSARSARDFKTGKTINIPATKAVKFKPGKGLKDAAASS